MATLIFLDPVRGTEGRNLRLLENPPRLWSPGKPGFRTTILAPEMGINIYVAPFNQAETTETIQAP